MQQVQNLSIVGAFPQSPPLAEGGTADSEGHGGNARMHEPLNDASRLGAKFFGHRGAKNASTHTHTLT